MKASLVVILAAAACVVARAQGGAPRIVSADPTTGKVGDVIAVSGENLGKETVAKVYLTDGTHDTLVEVTEQSGTTIKFKIPAKATGRLALMVLTGGKDAKLIEQPVKITIDE